MQTSTWHTVKEEQENVDDCAWEMKRLRWILRQIQSQRAAKNAPGDDTTQTTEQCGETLRWSDATNQQRNPQRQEWEQQIKLPLNGQRPERPIDLLECGGRGVHKEDHKHKQVAQPIELQ